MALKNNFVGLFFGRIYDAPIYFWFYLTFKSLLSNLYTVMSTIKLNDKASLIPPFEKGLKDLTSNIDKHNAVECPLHIKVMRVESNIFGKPFF